MSFGVDPLTAAKVVEIVRKGDQTSSHDQTLSECY